MSVVSITSERERRETEAWDTYIAARNRAERTGALEDGRLAARAWCAFIDIFATPAQRAFMNATVTTFGRRA